MNTAWEALPYLQNFIRLDFLFSGIEVSSAMIFAARVGVLLVFGGGLLYAAFRIVMKCLDCIQALPAALGALPRSFFLLVLFVIPLSSESLAGKALGYILLIGSVLAGVAALGLVMLAWKYGVDQTLRLVRSLRSWGDEEQVRDERSSFPPDNIVRTAPFQPPTEAASRPAAS